MPTIEAMRRSTLRRRNKDRMKADKHKDPKPTIKNPERPAEVKITRKRRGVHKNRGALEATTFKRSAT